MTFTTYEKIATIADSHFRRNISEGHFGKAVDVSNDVPWLARIEVTDGPSVLVRRDEGGRWEVFAKGFIAVDYDLEEAARTVLRVTDGVLFN